MIIANPHLIFNPPLIFSLMVIDCDSQAERLAIFSRVSMNVLSHSKIIQSRNIVKVLPREYIDEFLICVAIDDNGEFNAAIADNVQPILIDLVTFDPLNPLPYEPPA
jgi:hypothetical protein